MTLSADEDEHDVINIGLFTSFETGKIVRLIIIFEALQLGGRACGKRRLLHMHRAAPGLAALRGPRLYSGQMA